MRLATAFVLHPGAWSLHHFVKVTFSSHQSAAALTLKPLAVIAFRIKMDWKPPHAFSISVPEQEVCRCGLKIRERRGKSRISFFFHFSSLWIFRVLTEECRDGSSCFNKLFVQHCDFSCVCVKSGFFHIRSLLEDMIIYVLFRASRRCNYIRH